MPFLSHEYEEQRPWGSFQRFTLNEVSTVKILRIDAGKEFSLQKHSEREEFWKVIEGTGTLHLGHEERIVKAGDEIEIPVETLHRLAGGETGLVVLEISLGRFDEDDIVRVEDDFGRV